MKNIKPDQNKLRQEDEEPKKTSGKLISQAMVKKVAKLVKDRPSLVEALKNV